MPAAGKAAGRRAAKSSSKKSTSTRKPTKKSTKAAPRKSTAKRSTAKKSTPKKAAPKRSTPKKAAPKKSTAKKSTAKRSTAKKAVPKKAVPKKAAPKKAAPKKSTKAAPKKAAPVVKAPAAKAAAVAEKAAPAKKGGKKTVVCELSGFEVTPGTPNLSPRTLERLKARLLDERDRLLRQAHDFAAEAEQLAREREGGDTQFDEESGEGDTVNVERERDLLLSASARQEVEDIEKALQRMKRGTYGVCRYAGRRLPLERLEVRPWADVCVDCKARAERRR
jgi:RNA polymerase-binding transcription factor